MQQRMTDKELKSLQQISHNTLTDQITFLYYKAAAWLLLTAWAAARSVFEYHLLHGSAIVQNFVKTGP